MYSAPDFVIVSLERKNSFASGCYAWETANDTNIVGQERVCTGYIIDKGCTYTYQCYDGNMS